MFVLLGFYPLMEFRAVDSVTAHWLQSCRDTAQFGSPRLYTSHHLSTPPCKMHPTALTCPAGNLSPCWSPPCSNCTCGKLVAASKLWSMVLITRWKKTLKFDLIITETLDILPLVSAPFDSFFLSLCTPLEISFCSNVN